MVGDRVGLTGDVDGFEVGELEGDAEGLDVGELVGLSGLDVGTLLGLADGETVGAAVTGDMLGDDVGVSVTSLVVGFATGDVLGEAVGVFVGCSKPISATAGLLLGSCKYVFAKFEETFTQPNYIIIPSLHALTHLARGLAGRVCWIGGWTTGG